MRIAGLEISDISGNIVILFFLKSFLNFKSEIIQTTVFCSIMTKKMYNYLSVNSSTRGINVATYIKYLFLLIYAE